MPEKSVNQKAGRIADDKPLILAVDDDPCFLEIIERNVSDWGYLYKAVKSAAEMWETLEEVIPSVILLDIRLGDEDGTALVPQLKQSFPGIPIVIITANAAIESAVKCLKNGATDYLCKPLNFERLRIEIDKSIENNNLALGAQTLENASLSTDFHGMVGHSEPMRHVHHLIDIVAPTDAAVLILGQTGTGKELVARAIHKCSNRSTGPFVAVNAPAIPHELIESALFGHEKGAFTSADRNHIGYCEQADGGTLFLDEICEMDYHIQAKLLRFLQDHVVEPVGSKSKQRVDVRVIAATNREPKAQIEQNKLREDFYYRLSMITIQLAPLKERNGDIERLTHYFLDIARAKYNRTMSGISEDAMKLLGSYDWPGNVRQLEYLIHQIMITNNGPELTVKMLPADMTDDFLEDKLFAGSQTDIFEKKNIPSISDMEHRLIVQALESSSNSVPAAARILGISEATLYRKIKKFGLMRTFVEK